jgi:glycosyltransferase involved in cell wall biosynthesis
MRIAHYCKRFSGLSETFLYDYVTEEARQGIDARVVTHDRVNADQRPFPEVTVVPWPGIFNLERLGYRALEVIGQRSRRTSARPIIRRGLQEALSSIEPDLIHAHFGTSGVRIAPVARALGYPLVVTFYGFDVSELARKNEWRAWYRELWPITDAVTVLSEKMKGEVVTLGCPEEKVHVVHLGRDLDRFSYRSPKLPVHTFVSVGRLAEKKGHLDALRAVKQCVEDGADIHLRLIGEGALRDKIESYVDAQGLRDHVTILGALPNSAVGEELRDADAFILCSKTASTGDREGTPTVLIEAQAVGLPCVSTRHAGIPEMIPSSNHHLLAEEGDIAEIADCIRRLIESSAEEIERVSEAGRTKVEAEFDLTQEVERLRQVYRSTLSGSAIPAR